MFNGIKFKSGKKDQAALPVFDQIRQSCSNELREKGFETDVYLLPGGLGVRILNENHADLSKISHLPVKEIDFHYEGEANLDGLSASKSLSGLLFSKSELSSFANLEHLNLSKIHADGVSTQDFEFLKDHPLTELSLRKTELNSLDFLKNTAVEILLISNTKIGDRELQSLTTTELRVIDLFKCQITSLFPLRKFDIEDINISGTEVQDLSPLKNLPIKELEVRATKIDELSPVSSCPIEILNLPGSLVTSLSCISNCPIYDLNIVGLEIEDLSPLLNLPLIRLSISRDNIKKSHIDILKKLDLKFLNSPGDPIDQSPEVFFEKL